MLIQSGNHSDANFINNLLSAIADRPTIQKAAIEQWLKSAFQDDTKAAGTSSDNCIHLYNRSFYYSISECL